jgi:hypothetical protein
MPDTNSHKGENSRGCALPWTLFWNNPYSLFGTPLMGQFALTFRVAPRDLNVLPALAYGEVISRAGVLAHSYLDRYRMAGTC